MPRRLAHCQLKNNMKKQNIVKNYRKKRLSMVKKHHIKRLTSLLFTTTLLAACTSAPVGDLRTDLAQLTIPPQWMNAHATRQAEANANWWQNYQDADLNRLIEQALAHNKTVAAALTNWRQSLVSADSTLAQQAPQYNGELSTRASRDIDNASNSHSFSANLSASYQLDLWQKLDAQSESARLGADASGEDYLAARLT